MTKNSSPPPEYDIVLITTAALPWGTGPSFISLQHACGLAALGYRVLYVAPWLNQRSQSQLWGNQPRFDTFSDQAAWLKQESERIGASPLPTIRPYPAFYSKILRSIIPKKPVTRGLPTSRAIVMEEPEHLCWHLATPRRAYMPTEKVIGIVMTNYPYYVRESGWPASNMIARWVDRFHRYLIKKHTDKVLPISPAVAFEGLNHPVEVALITGVHARFKAVEPVGPQNKGVYFVGRLVWDKALAQVVEMAARTGRSIDIIGDGPDREGIERLAQRLNAPISLLGYSESPWRLIGSYRVFFNPSMSEVLCSATAEAIAAGRHVLISDCPANQPYMPYPNVHVFQDMDDAEKLLLRLLQRLPETPSQFRRDFDWLEGCRKIAQHCDLPPKDYLIQ